MDYAEEKLKEIFGLGECKKENEKLENIYRIMVYVLTIIFIINGILLFISHFHFS